MTRIQIMTRKLCILPAQPTEKYLGIIFIGNIFIASEINW